MSGTAQTLATQGLIRIGWQGTTEWRTLLQFDIDELKTQNVDIAIAAVHLCGLNCEPTNGLTTICLYEALDQPHGSAIAGPQPGNHAWWQLYGKPITQKVVERNHNGAILLVIPNEIAQQWLSTTNRTVDFVLALQQTGEPTNHVSFLGLTASLWRVRPNLGLWYTQGKHRSEFVQTNAALNAAHSQSSLE